MPASFSNKQSSANKKFAIENWVSCNGRNFLSQNRFCLNGKYIALFSIPTEKHHHIECTGNSLLEAQFIVQSLVTQKFQCSIYDIYSCTLSMCE